MVSSSPGCFSNTRSMTSHCVSFVRTLREVGLLFRTYRGGFILCDSIPLQEIQL